MTILPVPVTEALAVLNLPADLASNSLFQEHTPLVMELLSTYLEPASYAALSTSGDDEPSEALATNARASFCFLLLASTLEFLNLKTVGEGIVKNVGLDASQTALLTGAEIEAFQARLTRRALSALTPWLSDAGHAALASSFPSGPSGFRVALI